MLKKLLNTVTLQILVDEYERDYLLFQTSQSFQLSTSMCIVQIGEYVSRLSDEFNIIV